MIWYRCYGSTHIYTQFDAQNAGNSVSELPDFKFFFGDDALRCPQMPPDAPAAPAKGALWPLVNAVAYSSLTDCPLQTLLKPLDIAIFPLNTWGPAACFSKVPKLFGRIWVDIILFVSSKQRRLEAQNFAVIFIFIPFTTYKKTNSTE